MPHIADHELLLIAEEELDAVRAIEVRGHLEGCAVCRARQTAILQSLGDAIEEHLDQELPPIDGARTMLHARLRPARGQRYLALAALAAALLFMVFQFLPERESGLTPRSGLTPGATVEVSREAMCATGTEPARPAIPVVVAGEVFRKYGIHDPRPRAYEVDYLIPPDLGGSADMRNLWPQPYSEGTWNARVKDALEDRLRTMVCAGSLDLATAQRALADDWIGAYKRYFRTSEPLPDHLAFVKDRPWE
jgi:hypothetical protein